MKESPVFTRTYDLLMWLIPQVNKFPRVHRFGLGERIQRLALDFQDTLVAAGKSKCEPRLEFLKAADIHLEQLRLWVRFSRDNQFGFRFVVLHRFVNEGRQCVLTTVKRRGSKQNWLACCPVTSFAF